MDGNARETIVGVAIEFCGSVWTLPQPNRHHDVIRDRVERTGLRGSGRQGFVTSAGRFVDRAIAADIAYAAGQIAEPRVRLFSEDLW